MNIRKIVTYNNLRRQFTPEELAFADQLYSATESEKELIVESLQPQKPAAKKSGTTTRKVEHCVACNYTKRAAVHKDTSADGYHEFQSSKSSFPLIDQRCIVIRDGVPCGWFSDALVHTNSTLEGFHEFVAPQKSSKKAGKKSQRAQSLGEQLKQRPRGVVTGDDNEDDGRCTYKIGEDAGGPIICDTLPDNNVHHKRTDPDYHPFTPAASSAPPPSDQASSEIGKDAAGDVHRAASGGN